MRYVTSKAAYVQSLVVFAVLGLSACATRSGPDDSPLAKNDYMKFPDSIKPSLVTEQDCRRIETKAKEIASNIAISGDNIALRLAQLEKDEEKIFLVNNYISDRPISLYGHVRFSTEWFDDCMKRIPKASK